jgi:hypothetical protein
MYVFHVHDSTAQCNLPWIILLEPCVDGHTTEIHPGNISVLFITLNKL